MVSHRIWMQRRLPSGPDEAQPSSPRLDLRLGRHVRAAHGVLREWRVRAPGIWNPILSSLLWRFSIRYELRYTNDGIPNALALRAPRTGVRAPPRGDLDRAA